MAHDDTCHVYDIYSHVDIFVINKKKQQPGAKWTAKNTNTSDIFYNYIDVFTRRHNENYFLIRFICRSFFIKQHH